MTNHTLSHRQMAWLLASISAIMPFAIDAYLPAVPAMAMDLSTTSNYIQKTLSIFLYGQAIGLLVGGSLSDIKGRKPIILVGLLIFALSSLLIIFIHTYQQLMILRLIQAFGAGMVMATSGAIVRDYYEGQQAAQMFALIGIIMMIAPLLAPAIGTGLYQLFNWQAIFFFLFAYAMVVLILQYKYLPQRPIINQQKSLSRHCNDIIYRYKTVFRTRLALGFLFFQSFSFSSMFCFLIESPFIYMQYFQLSELNYAIIFALNLITMMGFNRITAWRLKQGTPPHLILTVGIIIQFIANISLLTLTLSQTMPSLALFVCIAMLSIGTQGFVSANTQACFMQFFKHEGGSANGVLYSCQALIAATIGFIATKVHDGTLITMPMMMLACTVIGSCLLFSFSSRIWTK